MVLNDSQERPLGTPAMFSASEPDGAVLFSPEPLYKRDILSVFEVLEEESIATSEAVLSIEEAGKTKDPQSHVVSSTSFIVSFINTKESFHLPFHCSFIEVTLTTVFK